MQFSINPIMKFFLQQHLVNRQEAYADPLSIGTLDEVRAVAKICSSDLVSRCLSYPSSMRPYPKLPQRSSLVALVDRGCHVHVMAIYTIQQMHQIEALPGVRDIQWNVLEMSEELEEELLKEINLEQGIIYSPLETMWKKPLQQ